MSLDMLRMTVNRAGVIEGMDWQDWWRHPSWEELDRLDVNDNARGGNHLR